MKVVSNFEPHTLLLGEEAGDENETHPTFSDRGNVRLRWAAILLRRRGRVSLLRLCVKLSAGLLCGAGGSGRRVCRLSGPGLFLDRRLLVSVRRAICVASGILGSSAVCGRVLGAAEVLRWPLLSRILAEIDAIVFAAVQPLAGKNAERRWAASL